MTSIIEHTDEWVRPPKSGQHLLGLGRSYLLQLAKNGSIKTVALRAPGKKRGVRLISLQSVRDFIDAEAARQTPEAGTAAQKPGTTIPHGQR